MKSLRKIKLRTPTRSLWKIRPGTPMKRGLQMFVCLESYPYGCALYELEDGKIIWRYVLPNLLSTLIVQATLTASKAVLAEAGLSFMGLGVPLPRAPWGAMLKTGYGLMRRTLWLSIFPGAFIMLLVMSLNFVGDGLRDALDIRIRAD